MATFVLKKYEENNQPKTIDLENTGTEEPGSKNKGLTNEITVNVSGSISEIVANALNKALVNKKVEISEVDTLSSEISAISTEDINNDPVLTFRSIKDSKVLLITTEGFKTKKEEWFLSNLETLNVGKVFYTLESFVNHIVLELGPNE